MNKREMLKTLRRQERESKRTIEERHALTPEQTALYQAVQGGVTVVYNERDGYWIRADTEARVTRAAVTLIQRGLLRIVQQTVSANGWYRSIGVLVVRSGGATKAQTAPKTLAQPSEGDCTG